MLHDTPPPGFRSRFTTVGVCLEKQGEILVLKRAAHKPQGGTWCLPAGKVDPGENPQDALVREVLEETGILLDRYALGEPTTWYVTWDADAFSWMVYRMQVIGNPEVVLRAEEHDEYRWVTPRDALGMELIEDQGDTFIQLYGLKR